MQKIFAAVLVILGLAGLVVGRLGETTWAPSTEQTATVDLGDAGPAVVIDPGVLYVGGETGTVEITAGSDVSIITAANDDIPAYLGDVKHTRITGVPTWDTLSTEVVNPDGPTQIEDPTGSDLWRSVETVPSPATIDVAEFSAQENDAESPQPYRAILLVTDGEQAGADSVSITWPVDARNEWVPYAYAGGAALAVIGLIWFVLAFRAGRPPEEEIADAAPQGGGAAAASLESPAATEPTPVGGRQTSLAAAVDDGDAGPDPEPAGDLPGPSDEETGPEADHPQEAESTDEQPAASWSPPEDLETTEPTEQTEPVYRSAALYTPGFDMDDREQPTAPASAIGPEDEPRSKEKAPPEPIVVEGRRAGESATDADPRTSTHPQADPEPTETLPRVESEPMSDEEAHAHGRRRGAPREDRP